MTVETVGSFLSPEPLADAVQKHAQGLLDLAQLTEAENTAVKEIVERQIACGLPFVTSGELRLKHWANDFWFGLNGVECENMDSGHVHQPLEAGTDHLKLNGRIAFNPEHPFFDDFKYLFKVVDGRVPCRQVLPSPANLLLEILLLPHSNYTDYYKDTDTLIDDIAAAYRDTIKHLYKLGCRSIQFDDTACGLMCDGHFTKILLQGGIDLIALHRQILRVINASLSGIPAEIETSLYLSSGDDVVPDWEVINYPDNIMPDVLSRAEVDKFFMPFDVGDDYALEILRHIPEGKKVVLGLMDAHIPFHDNCEEIAATVHKASKIIDRSLLEISPRSGFKISSYSSRGLTFEDQWRKLEELAGIV